MGCRDFVAVGGAGALLAELELGEVLIAERALRDEGTSYHYLEPSRFVSADETVSTAIAATLDDAGLAYRRGTTWTTDAIFREPRSRLDRRGGAGGPSPGRGGARLFSGAPHPAGRL